MTEQQNNLSTDDYLRMQLEYYNRDASNWSVTNKDPVVGWYDYHNSWTDYDNFLFKDFDTNGKVALEYGCGPGRNIVKFKDRFHRIDGVDISPVNIEKVLENINGVNGLNKPFLFANDGKTMPMIPSHTYDVVFSVICLQHICVHEVRYSIMKEIYRVLKPGGYFCAQQGFGHKDEPNHGYYDNNYGALTTNGGWDVFLNNEEYLKDDLLNKIGFINYKSDLRRPCQDHHPLWLWYQVQKPC